ncbi:GPW/gp25 family protein [Breoghania sp.]|uniref:GPW/gp25 family protein n=1 Tax=Breoghania sp. TaxID=2065378 RepID=UPI0029CA717F|nr:GPW/gp25 family protein [Breoghania sp.]
MMQAIRYRTGINAETGAVLRGWPHVVQSLGKIWTTRLQTRIMRLAFGSELFSRLGEDISPQLALQIYDDLTTAAHRFEPEYRLSSMQLVMATRDGGLGLKHAGTYYPEGRFGIYDFPEDKTAVVPLALLRNAAGAAA